MEFEDDILTERIDQLSNALDSLKKEFNSFRVNVQREVKTLQRMSNGRELNQKIQDLEQMVNGRLQTIEDFSGAPTMINDSDLEKRVSALESVEIGTKKAERIVSLF